MTPATPPHAKVWPVAGSVGIVREALKSPVRSGAVGTMAVLRKVLVVCRSPEYETKKNVWSLLSGPPRVAPNWFRLSGGLSSWDPQSLALSFSSRVYSNTEPRNLLVPDLVRTLITPLEKRPYSTA
jgi:hypothetical protein